MAKIMIFTFVLMKKIDIIKSAVFNQKITFRDPASGKIKEIPVSAVASQSNTSGFSAIKHKDIKRVVTVYSGLAPGETRCWCSCG